MSYSVQSGIWSSVFAVPSAVVDQHLKMCSPLSLKILLLMLRHPDIHPDIAWLSANLNMIPEEVEQAVGYWVSAGIIQETGVAELAASCPSCDPQSISVPKNEAGFVSQQIHPQTEQKVTVISARPKLSQEDAAALSERDPRLPELLEEAQTVWGAPLTPAESEILLALCGYYGMAAEAVLILLQYCVTTGHKNMNYLEKTAASWIEKGIRTYDQVEQEILRLSKNDENEKKIIKAFGLYNRGLTSRERELVEKWFSMGVDERLFPLACERAMENTGKVSFSYADKIICSWKARGIDTVKAAMEDLHAGALKWSGERQNRSAQTGGESSIDMDKLREMLYSPNTDGSVNGGE